MNNRTPPTLSAVDQPPEHTQFTQHTYVRGIAAISNRFPSGSNTVLS
jgi:hypothetical protein